MGARGKLLVSEAWRSLGANLSTTVAATMTVLIGMFLLGLFIALGTWTVSIAGSIGLRPPPATTGSSVSRSLLMSDALVGVTRKVSGSGLEPSSW